LKQQVLLTAVVFWQLSGKLDAHVTEAAAADPAAHAAPKTRCRNAILTQKIDYMSLTRSSFAQPEIFLNISIITPLILISCRAETISETAPTSIQSRRPAKSSAAFSIHWHFELPHPG
jgi:uncharacterized protein YbjT (DUF2867 family)